MHVSTDSVDRRLIPGTFEIRPPRGADAARAALEINYPVMATVASKLPAPRHAHTALGRTGAALGSLAAAVALAFLLGLLPKAVAFLLDWVG